MIPDRIDQKGAVTSVWYNDNTAELTFCLTSDRHHDSIYCNRDLEHEHLKEAQRQDAMIIDVGDLFDAMQGRYDPRRDYEELRPEYKVPHYYDVVGEDAAKFYRPFAKNFLMFGRGNHDNSIMKNANIDMLSRLTMDLRQHGSNVVCGGYGGWIVIYFAGKASSRTSVRIKYFHGAGGEAPVTKGVIQTARQAVYLPDADVVINGHSHNQYYVPLKRERITQKGELFWDMVHFLRTPGYKNGYGDGSSGWEVSTGMVPKPQGCFWMTIKNKYSGHNRVARPQIKIWGDSE